MGRWRSRVRKSERSPATGLPIRRWRPCSTPIRRGPGPSCWRCGSLILETAAKTPGVGALDETLKWGQPSYLTTETRSGSTIRIDRVKPGAGDDKERYALYVHCQTTLVWTFRRLYREELTFGGNRSILLEADRRLPKAAVRHRIALALTHHRNAAKDYL